MGAVNEKCVCGPETGVRDRHEEQRAEAEAEAAFIQEVSSDVARVRPMFLGAGYIEQGWRVYRSYPCKDGAVFSESACFTRFRGGYYVSVMRDGDCWRFSIRSLDSNAMWNSPGFSNAGEAKACAEQVLNDTISFEPV